MTFSTLSWCYPSDDTRPILNSLGTMQCGLRTGKALTNRRRNKQTSMKNFHWYFFILFYSIFFIWYSNLSGPLNDEEIDSFMKVISERSGNDEQNIQRLRKFMEEDDGKDFFMVNFLDYNESPETMPATGNCQLLALFLEIRCSLKS